MKSWHFSSTLPGVLLQAMRCPEPVCLAMVAENHPLGVSPELKSDPLPEFGATAQTCEKHVYPQW